MKLEEIMKDKDSLFEGRWFKRKYKNFCVRWNNDKCLFERLLEDCNNKDKGIVVYHFNPEDFTSHDWSWFKEKKMWHEGNFKGKYPSGVLCWVWDRTDDYDSRPINYHQEIIIDTYIGGNNTTIFKSWSNAYEYAVPVTIDEAPAIIG